MAYQTKVFIVQKRDGEVIGAKTAFGPAHALAKKNAPAKVLFAVADKNEEPNVMAHVSDQKICK